MNYSASASGPSSRGANTHRINPSDKVWPQMWKHLPDPPKQIVVSGNPEVLNSPSIAIVGTRRSSSRGLAVARSLAGALAASGWTIVSGMALGIDKAAHEGALDVGGTSIAVMATGIDKTYPRAHVSLRTRLELDGCCLTELYGGAQPLKHHFPKRNRLIAGLSKAVIVVEAPLKSGAMVTAYQALDYNREVFAVPGPVDLESSRGCHHLLRQGAHLMESIDDLHRIFTPPKGTLAGTGQPNLFPPEAGIPKPTPGSAAGWIYDRLDLEGQRRDNLRQRWPGNEEAWIEGILSLELAGLIRRLPGGVIARSIWRR